MKTFDDGRRRDYDRLQKKARGNGPDKWVPWDKDKGGEISVVHTSEPHGLLSYGWDGPKKFILYNDPHNMQRIPKKYREQRRKILWDLAVVMAEELNKSAPKGL